VQEILARHLPPGGVFVDVGASVGFFSLLGARLVGPTGRVVAFEPQPAAVASIGRNVEVNGFANVDVVQAAVGRAEEELFLRGVGTATAYLSEAVDSGGMRVQVTSLDTYFEHQEGCQPNLVKIDVEGHEHDVLLGMRSHLAGARPVVVIECHGPPSPLVDVLEEAVYAVSVVGSAMPARDAPASSHLLGTPAN
jgi:FkbM family methyltransferase